MRGLSPGCRVTGSQSRREAAVGRTSAEKAQAPQALPDLCVQHLFTRATTQPTMTNQCVREDVGCVCCGGLGVWPHSREPDSPPSLQKKKKKKRKI